MPINLRRFSIVLIVAALIAIGLRTAGAAEPNIDLRILVDISADVRTGQPDKSYLDALSLLAHRMPDQSAVGIWTFGKYTNYLVSHQAIDSAWRRMAVDKIGTIPAIASHRNIGMVLRKASYDIDFESAQPRHILLISAGDTLISDTASDNTTARREILTTLLPRLREAGYIIHTIALNKHSDNRLLSVLAKETGGFSFSLASPQDIYPAIEHLAQRLAPLNSIPINGQQFAVEAALDELDIFIRHLPGQEIEVSTPGGVPLDFSHSSVQYWSEGKAFALIKIKQPEMGHWRVTGNLLSQSRVFTKGGPQLKVEGLSDNYIAGENLALTVRLLGDSSNDTPSVSLNLIGEQTYNYDLPQDPSEPGVYQAQFNGFYAPGIYQVQAIAESLGFTRVLERPFQVYELLNIEVSKLPDAEPAEYLVNVQALDPELNIKQSTIVATVTDSSGGWTVNSVNLSDANTWELPVKDDGKSEELQVKLDFKGVTASGRSIHFQPKPLVIKLSRPEVAASELIIPKHKPIGVNNIPRGPAATPQVSPPSIWNQPVTLIAVALICLLAAVLLLLLYVFRGRNRRPQSPQRVTATGGAAASIAADNPPPAAAGQPLQNPPLVEEVVAEGNSEVEVEIDFAMLPQERDTAQESSEEVAKMPGPESDFSADNLQAEKGPIPAENSDFNEGFEYQQRFAEVPVEDAAENDLQDEIEDEGTELAAEWSHLDAESNIARNGETPDAEEEDIDIEFILDEEEGEEKSDQPRHDESGKG